MTDKILPSGDAAPIPALPTDFEVAALLCERWGLHTFDKGVRARVPSGKPDCSLVTVTPESLRKLVERLRALVPSSQPETPESVPIPLAQILASLKKHDGKIRSKQAAQFIEAALALGASIQSPTDTRAEVSAVELLRQDYNCASVEALVLSLHDDLTIARRGGVVIPAVISCDVCEMGTFGRDKQSRHGKPVQVLCNSCLDGDVRHDPRNIRRTRPREELLASLNVALWGVKGHTYPDGVVDRVLDWIDEHCGSLPVSGTDAIAAGSHVREHGNATTAESRAQSSTLKEPSLSVEQSTLDRIDASLAGVNGLPPHITIEDARFLRALVGPSRADTKEK